MVVETGARWARNMGSRERAREDGDGEWSRGCSHGWRFKVSRLQSGRGGLEEPRYGGSGRPGRKMSGTRNGARRDIR